MQVDSIEGVEAFLAAWSPSPYRAVVKPVEGAGSDGVSICDSRDGATSTREIMPSSCRAHAEIRPEIMPRSVRGASASTPHLCKGGGGGDDLGHTSATPRPHLGCTSARSRQSPAGVVAAYRALEGTKNVLGLTNYSVLLQEYLAGDEYVVDTVSRDGVHKCVALWKYDKRVYNGAPVVYYGMQLLAIDSEPRLAEMVGYTASVLDALGIRHGCCHTEIMLVERGPVLVEVNCRIHGGEGTWAPMPKCGIHDPCLPASTGPVPPG